MFISRAAAILTAGLTLACTSPAMAQYTASVVRQELPAGQMMLREGTVIRLKTLDPLNSKFSKVGDRFNLTVEEAVKVNGITIIPAGARAVGEVTNVIKKGSFGRSGKMNTQLLYVMLGDQKVRIDGKSYDQGSSGTAATVGVAIVAGVFSAFVTGKSADFPIGTAMNGYTAEDTVVAVESAPIAPVTISATPTAAVPTAIPAAAPASPAAAPPAGVSTPATKGN
ncbi:hypothetical protein [Sandaracinobacteroides saxicola]|uniref:FecR protein domain-containing protein n=1 Tax=Sandaracinobacteroides saxicola TaxID=2759707 RepID=A0A7G5IEU9_9SPHN|nr:hypothetical protein [Sandaracinobacteroides saxicola]QMW21891.1 hypothetical protein H3309_10880 [Sandaracinobacteroides saxicola]